MKKIYFIQKRFFLIYLVPVFLFALSGCFPVLDLEPREPADLSVRELIYKQNNVTDSERKWRKADSYYMRLKVSHTGKKTKDYFGSEIWYQHPKCFKLVTSRNGIRQKELIYNEGRVWSVNCRTNRSTELKSSSMEYMLFINTVRMGTPYMDYTDIFRNVTVDMFTENGVRYYRMICMSDDKRIQPYIFYYNGDTFLQEKMETINVLSESGASVLYTSKVEKYTTIDGIKLPEKTIVRSGGVTQISQLEEIILNKVYPESFFLPPVPFTHKVKMENRKMEKDRIPEKKEENRKEKGK